jgi:hypothetical protein
MVRSSIFVIFVVILIIKNKKHIHKQRRNCLIIVRVGVADPVDAPFSDGAAPLPKS